MKPYYQDEWIFKKDTAFRKQFFVPDSFAHPAKMDAQLLIRIVTDYTESGDVILDPMAGSGTTMLACQLGRHCVLVELEEKFCKMMRDNWEIVKMHPRLEHEIGTCQIIQGDARNLEGLLADKCIFSPPYAETVSQAGGELKGKFDGWLGKSCIEVRKYSDNPDNIGNLPYGNIDSIITSPPYEGSLHHDVTDREAEFEKLRAMGYKINPHSADNKVMGDRYSENPNNIGNLKSDTYLEAMLQVYQQCFKTLKDGGLMILVTKNFIRNKQIVRLDLDTIKLCERAGFSYLHRHYRKLPAQSFWRILYSKKHPEVEQIKYEDILVFQKMKP